MATGRVALVTGATGGLGGATSRALVAAGWRVVVAGRSGERLATLASELGDRVLSVSCDVRALPELDAAVDAARATFGQLDAVVANAGFGGGSGLESGDASRWEEMILTNVLGVAYTLRAAIPALRETHGHAVLVGSVAGRVAGPGSVYGATKAAVASLADAARKELLGSGVRVTLLEPGVIDTEFWDDGAPGTPLTADDVGGLVAHVLGLPPRVDVNAILVRPTGQAH